MSGYGGLNLTKNIYLETIRKKKKKDDLSKFTVFGLILGCLLCILGSMEFLVSTGIKEQAWILCILFGCLLIVLGVLTPSTLYYPEKAFRTFANLIGRCLFSILLTIIYVFFITPVGMVYRYFHKSGFYCWDDSLSGDMMGFTDKKDECSSINHNRFVMAAQFYIIIGYFIKNKRFFMIPVLVILLVLGLLLFFVSTSVVAPFIYTIF